MVLAMQHNILDMKIFQEPCSAEDTASPALLSLSPVPSSAAYFNDGPVIHLH